MGLYSTPAVRQAVLRLAWYIRPIRFEDSIRKRIGRPIRFEIRFERKKTIRRSLVLIYNSNYNTKISWDRDGGGGSYSVLVVQ